MRNKILLLAHNLIVLRVSLNVSTFGTKFNISSVTLQPKVVYFVDYNIIEIILKEMKKYHLNF